MKVLTQAAAAVTRVGGIGAVLLLVACDLSPPDTGYRPTAAAARAPFPTLLQQADVAAALTPPSPEETTEALAADAAALRTRAGDLSGPVIPAEDRAALEDAAQ